MNDKSAIDWQRGTWTPTGAANAAAEIVITSDWAPIRNFAPIIAAHPEAIYGDLLPLLRQADLCITNLECPLTDTETPVWKSGAVLKGAAKHIKGLAAVPFDIVTMANNHVFDYGVAAFTETTNLLDANNIDRLGAGMNASEACHPLVRDVNGIRLAIVNFSEGEDLTAAGDGPGVFGWEVEHVADMVADLKNRVHAVVVICHCGVEYIPFPPPYVADAFQRIAEAGADLIIGHHPHVPQGIQVHDNVPICYSLGNFVFYQETDLLFRKVGYLVKAGLGKQGLTHITVVPYEIRADRLALLTGEDLEEFMHSLEEISAPLSDNDSIAAAWHGFLCRYGLSGFEQEIGMLMEEIRKQPQKGAAMFRNRVATMQHNQHWIDALTRIVNGTINDAPDWAVALTEQWFTRKRTP
jgi:poly-gamma-glutamate capsule biosynthesis protein CapA/YwtB (metallophosphatase superfamily)